MNILSVPSDTTGDSSSQDSQLEQTARGPRNTTIDSELLKPATTVPVTPPALALEANATSRLEALLPPTTGSPTHPSVLHLGAVYEGIQKSACHKYDVQVVLKSVDLAHDYLCGYLRITGLTEMYPELTTFFEAEVISPRAIPSSEAIASKNNTFRTGHRWRSTNEVDFAHWCKFDAFLELLRERGLIEKSIDAIDLDTLRSWSPLDANAPGIFMRWKERFLVPDYKVERIEGASYEGFYYMYFDRPQQRFEGYYFHDTDSDQYQQISLQYVPQSNLSHCSFR
jgi:hypothetical protein